MGVLAIKQSHRGAGIVDEQFLASAVDLAHRALQALGKLAVVLAELRVAPGFDGVLGVVFVADLRAVLLPQQRQCHAFAVQLLVNAAVVGLGVDITGARRRKKLALEGRFVHRCHGGPVQTGGHSQADVLGDYAFGNAQGGRNLLVGPPTFEFETQGVFEFAHVDPWGGHGAPANAGKLLGSPG